MTRYYKAAFETPLTLDGAGLVFEQPSERTVDKARVLAHLQQQMAEHGIAIEKKDATHGDA